MKKTSDFSLQTTDFFSFLTSDFRQRRIEAVAAARFVNAARTDQHAIAAGDEPLCVIRRVTADDADGERLGDVLGDRQQLRHRLERASKEILIQPGDDDPLAAIREGVARSWQVLVEELPFVDSDHLGVVVDHPHELVRARHGARRNPHVAVRDDVIVAVAIVDERLEDLDSLAGDLRAAQAADQLLALAAEHAAGDDLNPARMTKT